MKKSLLTEIAVGLSLALGSAISAVATNPSSEANLNNTYYCAQLNGSWNTFVNTPRGQVKLVNWVESLSDEWNPQNRCVEISGRFQKFLDAGTLKYIRTGTVNRLPVICVAESRGGTCPDQNVLITLKPGTDQEAVLIRMLDFRRSVSGQTILLSENDSGFYADGEFYVEMDKFLEKVPVEK
ncbi:conserved exported hypothetical protein [Hyella patelloides LEGE 07179]|uniref:Uncharacterized protein n=1 Tax=Hyella patelloides LEGE 07179 TaxID=945734 RepID=A0A563VL31_9CYAN|nr:COP23 domain-containing protein [Hyella patelloides]VEP12128.1 conserved exported hypothetical protein [Hyella patelloides LEGE 07179]